ncbi:chaperonin 10-like protein [Leptodontidium sp. 2 PMI_412]|nr:chaperonin 10-like protein [Leptodontidium sp. 2 PMI_412]
MDGQSILFTMQGFTLPEMQEAVITANMRSTLNLQKTSIPVKRPVLGEVVVRVSWTGICRSDVCFSLGPEPGFPKYDHVAGHEGIGHVVQSFDPCLLGRPVAMRYLAQSCGSCYLCLRGVPENCAEQTNFPKNYNGTFQQFVTAPWVAMMPLPSWVFDTKSTINPATATAALCSGSTALKALKTASPQPNSVVVVVGIMGAIGHLVGLLAKQVYNCRVIGIDWEFKRNSFGANSHTVYDIFIPMPAAADAKDTQTLFQVDLQKACYTLRGFHCMADACIVTASSISGANRAPDYVRDGGSIVFVGAPRGGNSISLPLQTLVERQLRLQGSMMGGREEAYQMLHYIQTQQITPLITSISLEGLSNFMEGFLEDHSKGKAVCCVNEPLP